MDTKNYVGAGGLPAIFSIPRCPDSQFGTSKAIAARPAFLSRRESHVSVELPEPIMEKRQITFFRTEMTVKFHVECGPARVPHRARRIPASPANALQHARLLGPPVDLPHATSAAGKLLKFSMRRN